MRSHRDLSAVFTSFALAGAILLLTNTTGEARQLPSVSSDLPLIERQIAAKPVETKISAGVDIAHVVVKFSDRYEIRLRDDRLVSRQGLPATDAENILQAYLDGGMSRLLREVPESKLDRDREALQIRTGYELADMNGYYRIQVAGAGEAEAIINQLNALDMVELAYFQPSPEPAEDIDPPTPNYQPSQDYREAAPAGVDADYANTLPGGDGSGVKIVDIEGGWQTTHEDLEKSLGGLLGGAMINDPSWMNHGTAVIGEMIAGDNGYGVTGICPGADIGMVGIGSLSTAEALYLATDNLQPGDLILIELHAPGPHFNFESRDDQLGYVCMEYWQANFDAIQYAWASGITVIEAAGNGAENFDDANIYGQLFDTTFRNSHAIVAGAGWPAASSNDRIRHGFSNYGERVNLQGYGSGVYTTGYGGLFAPNGDENQFYTAGFSGTSSASPIVTGAAACLQGYYKATYGTFMTSDMIREVFDATGSPQLGNIAQHIGPRPDLQAAIGALVGPPSLYVSPLLLETTLTEEETVVLPIWLHNRSGETSLDFSIVDNDSLPRIVVPDWLQAAPSSGSINPADSVKIDITIDGTVLEARSDIYKGIVTVNWNASGSQLDSTSFLPVFLEIQCNDDSYIAESTGDVGGPTYEWISAKDLGSKISEGDFYNTFGGNPLDDGTTGPHSVGFEFPFYGTTYSDTYIAVNGALSFTDVEVNVNGFYSGLSIPGAPFTTFIAPFYADLIINTGTHPDAGIYLYRSSSSDTLVIEWHRIANFNASGTTLSFEVILTNDGNIVCQYNSVEASGLDLTALIGIQEVGCLAIEYFNAGGSPETQVSDQETVRFRVNYSGCCVGPTGNVDCDPGNNVDLSDLTRLIDYLFISFDPLCCFEEADVSPDETVDLGDLTRMIDYLFISFDPLGFCQ